MSYYGVCVTADGKALITKLMASKGQLVISGIMVGKGKCPDDVYPGSLHDLIDPVAAGTITAPVYDSDTVTMTVQYRNDLNGGLKNDFYLNEFGVFAEDPDKGKILLYYGTLGDEPEYVRSFTEGAVVVRNYPISITISEDADIKVSVETEAWITADDLANYVGAVALTRETIDILIPVSAWQRDEGAATRYIYYADVLNDSISADAIPDVVLDIKSLETACDCGLCPTVQTLEAGTLRFLAEAAPDKDITGSCTLYRQGNGSPVPDFGGSTSLPIASATTLGGVKVGSGLIIAEDGTLSADMGADTDVDQMIEEIYGQPDSSVSADNVASDEAVQDMIEEVYGQPDTDITEADIATDAEVTEMIEDIYGKEV